MQIDELHTFLVSSFGERIENRKWRFQIFFKIKYWETSKLFLFVRTNSEGSYQEEKKRNNNRQLFTIYKFNRHIQ